MTSPPDLYTPAILDHARNPRHRGPLPDATHTGEGHNPMCGDRVTVRLLIWERVDVRAIAWEGEGCNVCMASASMMADVIGTGPRAFVAMAAALWGDKPWEYEHLPDLRPVEFFPTRHKCAALPWDALREALSHG